MSRFELIARAARGTERGFAKRRRPRRLAAPLRRSTQLLALASVAAFAFDAARASAQTIDNEARPASTQVGPHSDASPQHAAFAG